MRGFYARDDSSAVGFYARRLRALYERDRREAEVGRLGFAFHVNGQDTEDDWRETLELVPLAADDAHAEVQVSFRNFGPQHLRYDLVREDGRWLIANVRSLTAKPWDLMALLSPELR